MSPQTLQNRLGIPTFDSSIVVGCCISIGTKDDDKLVDLRFACD
jgi:hypothetical protein